jgi:hypothetical protein
MRAIDRNKCTGRIIMNRSCYCLLVLAVLFSGIIPCGFAQQPALTSTIGGGGGGTPFTDETIPNGSRVSEVYIFSGDFVDAVQMQYILPNGKKAMGPRHGGSGGGQNIFRLDSDEYIVGLSIKYGEYIDSLQVQTNKRTSSTFGGFGGSNSYKVQVPSGNQAIGFTGRAGEFLDSIGLVYIPLTMRISGQTEIAGGNGGNAFSDRSIPGEARISEIRVRAGDSIDGIQAIYVLKDGRAFEGPMHGGGGGSLNVFRLNPGEYITGLSGRYGIYLDSLTIQTNQRSSQAFGGGGGNRNFTITVPQGNMAVSFAGRSGEFLDSISLNYATIENPSSRGRENPSQRGRENPSQRRREDQSGSGR